jgi:hypothetical protein
MSATLPKGPSHDPVKLFHPSMTAKQFSGWYDVIFPTQENKQNQGAAIGSLD